MSQPQPPGTAVDDANWKNGLAVRAAAAAHAAVVIMDVLSGQSLLLLVPRAIAPAALNTGAAGRGEAAQHCPQACVWAGWDRAPGVMRGTHQACKHM